jgi:hypothetical protein
MATVSTAERLEQLLDWLNDENWARNELRWLDKMPGRLRRFIQSFDGSEDAGYVEAREWSDDDDVPELPVSDAPKFINEAEELSLLHTRLVDILKHGFPQDATYEPPFLPPLKGLSLEFGVKRVAPQRPVGKRNLKKWTGAYVVQVAAARFDLVQYLFIHLLTLPGAVALRRCDAPKAYSTERCGRFFVVSGPGRPKEVCQDKCEQRRYWERDRTVGRGKAAAKRRMRRRKSW